MRKKVFAVGVFIALLVCAAFVVIIYYGEPPVSPDDPYHYPYEFPVLPYMKAWARLSEDERWEAYNAPQEILDSLSTKELFLTLMQCDDLEFSQGTHPRPCVCSEFLEMKNNVFRELIWREDVVFALDELEAEGNPYPTDFSYENVHTNRKDFLGHCASKWDLNLLICRWGAEYAQVKGDPNHTKEDLWNAGMSSYITIIEG